MDRKGVRLNSLGLLLSVVWLVGCSGVGFGSSSGSTGKDNTTGLNPNPHPGPAPAPTPTPNPNPVPNPNALPVVSWSAPPCKAAGPCPITFSLATPMQYTVTFQWETNDSLYGTPPPAGDPPYGKPGVQYTSTTWATVTFNPGDTSQTVVVQDINPDPTVAITIPFEMQTCMYNGNVYDCAQFFTAN